VELTCESPGSWICRGAHLYYKLTVTNGTGGNISGNLTLSGYYDHGCNPQNLLAFKTVRRAYGPGATVERYRFKVPNALAPRQYSASVSGTLGGYEVFCCMDIEIFDCLLWAKGDNNTWELMEANREEAEAALPGVTSLVRNHPNPFNATTRTGYKLTETANVTLKVYDISGCLVETLVDGYQEAGEHVVTWDASGVSSGVYFCKLTAGDYSFSKKMNLLR